MGGASNGTMNGNSTNGQTNGVDAASASYEVGAGEHQGAIKSIIWLRDPNLLVTAADDKKIRWYDLRTPTTAIATYEIDGPPGSCELNSITSTTSPTTSVIDTKCLNEVGRIAPAKLTPHS